MSTPDRRHEWAVLAALMLGFAALFVWYYPPISGVEDEAGFVNQALVWSRGAITPQGAGWSRLLEFEPVKGRDVATRHPGRSLVVLPFLMLGGSRALFASGLLLHLTTTAIAAALLVKLGRSPLWAVLVLCHPTLALYSRTILADAASGTGVLLATLAAASEGPAAGVCAGLAVGLGALMRHHAGMALPLVAASFLSPSDRPHRWRQAALCFAAGAGAGGGIVAYNLAVYGTPLEPFTAKRGFFAWRFLIPHLQFYGTALLVLWPGMLLAPVLDRSRIRWLVRGLCALFLGSLLLYYFHDTRPSWLETAILGQRLLQVILPLWIVSYAGVLDDWIVVPLRRRLEKFMSSSPPDDRLGVSPPLTPPSQGGERERPGGVIPSL